MMLKMMMLTLVCFLAFRRAWKRNRMIGWKEVVRQSLVVVLNPGSLRMR